MDTYPLAKDVKWWKDGQGWVFDPTWIRRKFDPWVRAIPSIKWRRDIFPGSYVPWNNTMHTCPF